MPEKRVRCDLSKRKGSRQAASLRLVARTGTLIPGVGTLAQFINGNGAPPGETSGGCVINNRGQVLFSAILSDGSVGLFIATPAPSR